VIQLAKKRAKAEKKEKKPKVLMGVQQNLIYCDDETKSIITFLCEQSNSLYNCGLYWARQLFFKTGKIISKFDPIYEVGGNMFDQRGKNKTLERHYKMSQTE